MIAQAKPITLEWMSWFPTEIAMNAVIGTAIATAVWVLQQRRKAADPANSMPSAGDVGIGVVAMCNFIIGAGLAILFTKLIANYFGIETTIYVNSIAGGLGFFGVPLAIALVKLGDWLTSDPIALLRAIVTKQLPKIGDQK